MIFWKFLLLNPISQTMFWSPSQYLSLVHVIPTSFSPCFSYLSPCLHYTNPRWSVVPTQRQSPKFCCLLVHCGSPLCPHCRTTFANKILLLLLSNPYPPSLSPCYLYPFPYDIAVPFLLLPVSLFSCFFYHSPFLCCLSHCNPFPSTATCIPLLMLSFSLFPSPIGICVPLLL